MPVATLIGVGLCVLRFVSGDLAVWIVAVAAMAPLAVAAVWGLTRPIPWVAVARAVDQRYALADRTLSALANLRQFDRDSWLSAVAELQVRNAVGRLEPIRARDVAALRTSGRNGVLAFVLVLALLAGVAIGPENRDGRVETSAGRARRHRFDDQRWPAAFEDLSTELLTQPAGVGEPAGPLALQQRKQESYLGDNAATERYFEWMDRKSTAPLHRPTASNSRLGDLGAAFLAAWRANRYVVAFDLRFQPDAAKSAHRVSRSALRQCRIEMDQLGQPRPRSGNFATVYRANLPDGNPLAIKVFNRRADERRERYRAISDYLERHQPPALVRFEYDDRGIRSSSDGKLYPLLAMDWVEGATLFDWARDRSLVADTAALALAAQDWFDVTRELAAAGIVHGDLQHGNVMVSPDGRIRLVDYDGMAVPGLMGQTNPEVGLAPYQHPARNPQTLVFPGLDNFSALVIYVALRALAEDPSLWSRHVEARASDKLLFDEQDFAQPPSSPLYRELLALADAEVRGLVHYLFALWSVGLHEVPPIGDVRLWCRGSTNCCTSATGNRQCSWPCGWAPASRCRLPCSRCSPRPAAGCIAAGRSSGPSRPTTIGRSPATMCRTCSTTFRMPRG